MLAALANRASHGCGAQEGIPMRSLFTRRPQPATVISIVALVVASTGTGYAASYVITSTKQVKPSVLKALKGKRGKRGLPGAVGPVGPVGPAGPAGTARAYAQVTNDGANTSFQSAVGFVGNPRRAAQGKICIPVPPGISPNTPIQLSLSGGTAGFVTHRNQSGVCTGSEWEIWTADTTNAFSDVVWFNILVP
jgi:hypothetical protein